MSRPNRHQQECPRDTARKRLLALGAALLLGLLVPRFAATGQHDHAPDAFSAEACAACLVAHTPALEHQAIEQPAAPSLVAVATLQAPALPLVEVFDRAVPVACGPPA